MNKVIFLIGTIVISLLGAMFFALGAFSVSNHVPTSPIDVPRLSDYISSEKQLMQKIEKIISPDVAHTSYSSQKTLKTPQRKITVEMLLQDVASKHEKDSDRCMQGIREKKSVTQFFVFVGCFLEASAYEIAKALRVNGYITHMEYMVATNSVLVLCGPFKSKMSAETLYKWLLSQGYVEARMIEPVGYQTVWNMPYNTEALSSANTPYTHTLDSKHSQSIASSTAVHTSPSTIAASSARSSVPIATDSAAIVASSARQS